MTSNKSIRKSLKTINAFKKVVELATKHSGSKKLLKECLETGVICTVKVLESGYDATVQYLKHRYTCYTTGFKVQHSSKPGTTGEEKNFGFVEPDRVIYTTVNDHSLLQYVSTEFTLFKRKECEAVPYAYERNGETCSVFPVNKGKIKELLALM